MVVLSKHEPTSEFAAFINGIIYPSGPLSIWVRSYGYTRYYRLSTVSVESLVLTFRGSLALHQEYPADLNTTSNFDMIGRLRTLDLASKSGCCWRTSHILGLPLPWSQLTHLDLNLHDGPNIPTFCHIIRQCIRSAMLQ